MRNIIEAIIECDGKAKKIVDRAHAKRKEIEQSIPIEIEKVRREAYEAVEVTLDAARAAAKEQTAAEIEKINAYREQKLNEFREIYLTRSEEWINNIYQAVISDAEQAK